MEYLIAAIVIVILVALVAFAPRSRGTRSAVPARDPRERIDPSLPFAGNIDGARVIDPTEVIRAGGRLVSESTPWGQRIIVDCKGGGYSERHHANDREEPRLYCRGEEMYRSAVPAGHLGLGTVEEGKTRRAAILQNALNRAETAEGERDAVKNQLTETQKSLSILQKEKEAADKKAADEKAAKEKEAADKSKNKGGGNSKKK